jgi:hypothetical protein
MKQILVILAIMGIAGTVCAQKDPVTAVFEKYAGTEGFTTINISGDMLNMITKAEEDRRDTTFQSKLTEIKILVREKNCDETAGPDLKTEVLDKIDKKVYKEMMTVKQEDENVIILVKESGGRISELLLVVSGKDENVLIQAKGDMLLSEMADMAGKCQMKGFDQLRKLDK